MTGIAASLLRGTGNLRRRFNKLHPLLEMAGFCQQRCACCGQLFFPSQLPGYPNLCTTLLCESCQEMLAPYTGLRCRLCGLPIGLEDESSFNLSLRRKHGGPICEACARKTPVWKGLAYYGLYSGPLRELCLLLKFNGKLHIRLLFAEFLLQAASCLPAPDIIVPVPQYPKNLLARGFNQANEIARALAAAGGLSCRDDLLWRTRPGIPQEALTAAERRVNLRDAFGASDRVTGKKIWLVDDVVTTGSTMTFATQALLLAGASCVYGLAVARTALEQ